MALWLLLRSLARERAGGPAHGRLLANAADALAFSLLISQSVWEHHFLFALPLVILAVATRWRERPLAVAVSVFLVLGMPTFDLFPLSYHRAAGLIGLLVVTRPEPRLRSYSTTIFARRICCGRPASNSLPEPGAEQPDLVVVASRRERARELHALGLLVGERERSIDGRPPSRSRDADRCSGRTGRCSPGG